MTRYLIIAAGMLIGLNDLRMLIDAHWIVVNNTWEIVDFSIMALFVVSGLVNKKSFYAVTLVFCSLILILASVGVYNIYFRRDYPLTIFAFVRPVLLLVALYALIKSINHSDSAITN
jgi:hypothetical protein